MLALQAYFVETREREPVLGVCVSGVEAFVCINLQMKTGRSEGEIWAVTPALNAALWSSTAGVGQSTG